MCHEGSWGPLKGSAEHELGLTLELYRVTPHRCNIFLQIPWTIPMLPNFVVREYSLLNQLLIKWDADLFLRKKLFLFLYLTNLREKLKLINYRRFRRILALKKPIFSGLQMNEKSYLRIIFLVRQLTKPFTWQMFRYLSAWK